MMKRSTKAEKQQRLIEANRIIKVIASHGRRFFFCKEKNTFAEFYFDDHGILWLRDEYTQKSIYVCCNGRWRYFSNGGTLRDIIRALRDYIRLNEPLNAGIFGPWANWICDRDLWGYGKPEMAKLREELYSSPAIVSDLEYSQRHRDMAA